MSAILNGKLCPISGGRTQAVSAQLGEGRTAFNPPPLSVRGVQALKKGVKKCLWDGMKWIPIPDGSELLSTEKPEAFVKPLQELQPAKENGRLRHGTFAILLQCYPAKRFQCFILIPGYRTFGFKATG